MDKVTVVFANKEVYAVCKSDASAKRFVKAYFEKYASNLCIQLAQGMDGERYYSAITVDGPVEFVLRDYELQ